MVELEDVFQHDMHDQIQTSGIAGSGKSTAFMEKAPFEWAKVTDFDPPRGHCPFWPHIALFLRGSLTNKKWWKAQDLGEIFGLSRYNLTQQEEWDVIKYIKSHSQQVLLVTDALDEATVEEDSLLWEILTGKCEDLPRLKLIIILFRPCERALWLSTNCLFHRRLEVVGVHRRDFGTFHPSVYRMHSAEGTPAAGTAVQSRGCERAHAHSSPGNTNVSSVPTGHGVAKHTNWRVSVICAVHASPVVRGSKEENSQEHRGWTVPSWVAGHHGEFVQACVRKAQEDRGGFHGNTAFVFELSDHECGSRSRVFVVVTLCRHRRPRRGCVLLPASYIARVFHSPACSPRVQPSTREEEHLCSRRRAWCGRWICAILAVCERPPLRITLWVTSEL